MFGLALMITLTVLYSSEIGWRWLIGAWAVVVLAAFLPLVGVSGWLGFLVQATVVAGLYLKAKSDG